MARPRTKHNASRISLTLSEPAREWILKEAIRTGTSRTHIVEQLVEASIAENTQDEALPFTAPSPVQSPSKYPVPGRKKSSG